MIFCPDVPISEEQLKILISQASDKQSHYNSFFASYSIDNRKKYATWHTNKFSVKNVRSIFGSGYPYLWLPEQFKIKYPFIV